MTVETIGKLTTEELNRWRLISANKELVDDAFPGLSVVEARGFIMDFYRFIGEIMENRDISATTPFEITVSDGAIIGMRDD